MFNVKEIIESIVPSILRINCEREFCNNRYFKVRHSLSRNNTYSQPTRMYEINTPGLTLLTSKFSSPNRIEKDQKPKFEGPSFKSTTLLPDALSGCENKYIHIKGLLSFRFQRIKSDAKQYHRKQSFEINLKTTFFFYKPFPTSNIIVTMIKITWKIKSEEN